jgi:hypothetical protein
MLLLLLLLLHITASVRTHALRAFSHAVLCARFIANIEPPKPLAIKHACSCAAVKKKCSH